MISVYNLDPEINLYEQLRVQSNAEEFVSEKNQGSETYEHSLDILYSSLW